VISLRGERCVVRDGRADDEAIIRGWLEPGHAWAKTDGPYYPFFTPEQADEFARKLANSGTVAPGQLAKSAIVADPDTDALLGYVNWHWYSEETQWPRLGIVLFPDEARGRGVGREAIALWTDYLLGNSDWPRLDLATWSGNVGMARAALAAGFREEGRFRDARIVDGKRYDGLVYGITRADWAQRNSAARLLATGSTARMSLPLTPRAGG
jgi:RimJ/RimL family protein N-acetyltransferase